MNLKVIYKTTLNRIPYRIRQYTDGKDDDCIVEYNISGWRALDDDAECAQIYMMAFLKEREKNNVTTNK
jgi:hypothetical protein